MTQYDEEIIDGIIEDESDDIGEVGGGFKPLSVQHFIGSDENPIKGSDGYAKGYRIQTARYANDEKFQAVVASMIKDKTAWIEVIHHPGTNGGKDVEYLALKDWSFYPLTPNIPSIDMIAKNINEAKGLATGMTIVWDEQRKAEKAKRVSYTSLLVVVKSLYDHGYSDEFTGSPTPIALRFNSYNAGDLSKALIISHNFVTKAVRTFKEPAVGVFKARGQEVLYTYLVQYQVSKERHPRGKTPDKKQPGQEGGTKNCFIMENINSDPKLWTPQLEKKLYCGDDLAVKLRDLMYVVVNSNGVQKRVSGGLARDFCFREIERNLEIVRNLDPKGEFNKTWGTFTVPAHWFIKAQLAEQDGLRRAVQGEAEPVEDTRTDIEKEIQRYALRFRADPTGKELVNNARQFMLDATMDDGQKESLVAEVLEALAARETEIGVPF